jgi:hypothetical protein
MSSNSDRIHLLEPSDLMEPFDLRDGRDRVPDLEGPSSGRGPASRVRYMRPRAGAPAFASLRGGWPPKTGLIVAGALVCFGAGVALPRLASHSQPPAGATATVAGDAAVRPGQSTGEIKPAQPAAEAGPAQPTGQRASAERTSAQPLTASTNAAPDSDHSSEQGNAVPPPIAPPLAPAREEGASRVNPVAAGGAAPCTPQARATDGCVDDDAAGRVSNDVPRRATKAARSAAPDATDGRAIVPGRHAVDPRQTAGRQDASGRQDDAGRQDVSGRREGRSDRRDEARPSSRHWRLAERNTGDQQPATEDAAAAPRPADERVRSGRDGDYAWSRRQHRAPADEVARSDFGRWERTEDRDHGRRWSWRSDRDDGDSDSRGDARRNSGRPVREDDRPIRSGPPFGGLFPFLGGW